MPTYQRRALVERALVGLSRQSLPAAAYEVVVVMDGSEDGTREMLTQARMPYLLRTIWQPNRGRAAACNAGIRLARGELIVLLDDDMEASPELLEAHLRAHAGYSDLVVIGAAPIKVDRAAPPVKQYIAAKFNGHLDRLARPGHRLGLRDFYSGNLSILRRRMLDVGGFDEAFTIYGNEDLELLIRLRQAGVRLLYCPAALAHQNNDKSFAQLANDSLAKGRTSVLLASKHPQAIPELRLGAQACLPPHRRLFRSGLLRIGVLWSGGADLMVGLLERLEHQTLLPLGRVYRPALEYFYWVGVMQALKENRRAGRGLASLPRQDAKAL